MSQKTEMNEQRYEQIIESYGTNPARWPEQERALAQTFAQENPDLTAQIHASAAELDILLDSNVHVGSSDNLLMARIMKSAQDMPQDGRPANDRAYYAPVQARWKSLAATLLLTTGLGFGIGQTAAADSEYQIAEALLSTDYQTNFEAADWTEFSNE